MRAKSRATQSFYFLYRDKTCPIKFPINYLCILSATPPVGTPFMQVNYNSQIQPNVGFNCIKAP